MTEQRAEDSMAGLGGEWQRLHPLSPVIRAGRGLPVIVLIMLSPSAGRHQNSTVNAAIHVGVIVLVFALGVITWLITRWRVEQGVLRVERGLIRRRSERFPLSQIQAIDVVRPGLARIFALAELRIRLASGGGSSGRLAYLSDSDAEVLRERLLAMSGGQAEAATQTPPERVLSTVPPQRLLVSLLLTAAGLLAVVVIVALAVLAIVSPRTAAAAIGAGTGFLIGLATVLFRRFNGGYRLTVADAPDGLRVRSGLVETAAETIPRGRIQALRMVEPFVWRALGWCRVEVHVATQRSRGRQDRNEARAVRALLPVGTRATAMQLIDHVFAGLPDERRAPPPRARIKSPLRFRHLAYGTNDQYAVTTTGRVRRVTDYVPLAKVQSIRQVEGPVQRRMRLSSIHLDTAGRNVRAVMRDRDREEAEGLLRELPDRCRAARKPSGV